jgi:hypothetical protein
MQLLPFACVGPYSHRLWLSVDVLLLSLVVKVVEVVEVVHPSMNWFVESYYRKSPKVESPEAQRGQSKKITGQKRNI